MELISKSRLERARALGADILERGPVAVAARYRAGMIFIELSSGVEIRFPVRLAQGLENASPKDLTEIQIEARGLGLHWPRLDADLHVPSLLQGVLGTKKWMAEIGKLGGRVTSAAKAKAAAKNGKLGGRPRKAVAAAEKKSATAPG